MNGILKKTLFRVNAITLICFPSFVLADTPWRVTDGSTLNATSNYAANSAGDVPLYASGAGSKLTTNNGLNFMSSFKGLDVAQITGGAGLELNQTGLITKGEGSRGIFLQGSQLTMSGGSVSTQGNDSTALEAQAGSTVSVEGAKFATNASTKNDTLKISDSNVTLIDSSIDSNGIGSGISISGTSDISLKNVELSMSDNDAFSGISITQGKLTAEKLILTSNAGIGISATGINNTDKPEVTLTGGKLNVTGGIAVASENSNIILNDVTIATKGKEKGSHAVNVKQNGNVTITGGDYSTNGDMSHALYLQDATAVVSAKQLTLSAKDSSAYGIAAEKGTVTLSESTINTFGHAGHAAVSKAGDVTISGTQLSTMGEDAYSVLASEGGKVQLSSGDLQTLGSNSSGIVASTGGVVTGENLKVSTSGADAHVLFVNEGEIRLKDSQIKTEDTTAAAIFALGENNPSKSTVSLDGGTVATNGGTVIVSQGGNVDVELKNGIQAGTDNALLAASTSRTNTLDNSGNLSVLADTNVILKGDIAAENNSIVNLSLRNQSAWSGAALSAADVAVDNSSQWNITKNSDVANLNNAGQVVFPEIKADPVVLTVRNNYHGDNGTLVFNTVLGDDNSQTNKMVVEGDTSGTTQVKVNNLGGKGAYTQGNGIELIQVKGQSDGEFVQQGRIVAGAYDYSLMRGKGEAQSNWYLSNLKPTVIDEEPIIDPANPIPDTGTPDNGNKSPAINNDGGATRPESGIYLANLAAANNLFVMRLHDRLGETQYSDSLSDQGHATSLWLRQVGGRNTSYNSDGQLKMSSNRYVAQLGGDVVSWSQDSLDRWHLGVMAGYGQSKSKTRSSAYGYSASGEIHGYSAGVYGTWYANDADKTGAWVDSWVLYNWFNNSVKGDGLPEENYRSKGLIASLEAGYTSLITDFEGSHGSVNQWLIQPKAQVVWQGVDADNHREANGTRVTAKSNDNIMTSLGVRTFLKGRHIQDAGTLRQFEPFVEMNWIHNTDTAQTYLDNSLVKMAGSRDLGEMKVGLEAQFTKGFKGWTNFSQRMGDAGYSDSQFMAGINYQF